MHLIISTNLTPKSKARILADYSKRIFNAKNMDAEIIDLSEIELPLCDGKKCYENSMVQELTKTIRNAESLLIVSPIYNYDVNAAAKNLLELTGSGWNEKIVGFICNAGGEKSYMSVMPYANSLMLDHRCHIIPRFVYAAGSAFTDQILTDNDIKRRIEELVSTIIDWSS